MARKAKRTRSQVRPATRRPRLSLCMIVRDNRRTIEACLTSIRPWVDELIVVDTGSVDETPQIAARLGAQVSTFPWCDDFSAARNVSLERAAGEWLFWMDSDDTTPPECGRKLRALADGAHPDNVLGYVMQVHCPGPEGTDFDDLTVVDHVKLFRNRSELRFEGRIHEQIIPAIRRLGGDVGWTDIHVVHSGSEHAPAAKQRKYERDLRLLKLELAQHPDHPFHLFNMGMTYNDMEQHEVAVDWLRKSLAVSRPDESHVRKVYALLVASLTHLERWPEAEQASREGLRHFPHDPELRFRQGLLAHAQRRLQEAISAYRAALRNEDERHFSSLDPGIAGHKARHNLALVYEELGRHDLAELQWRLVIDVAPRFRPAWRALHGTLLARQMTSTAQVEVERMQSLSHVRADGQVASAQAAERQGDLARARAELESAIVLRPGDSVIWEAWCRFLFDHGTLSEAATALHRLLELSPGNGPAWHNLGVVLIRQGELSLAEESLERSLELRPDSEATRADLEMVRRAMARC